MYDTIVVSRKKLAKLLAQRLPKDPAAAIRLVEEKATTKLFVVDYHHRHGNDCPVLASDTEPDSDEAIELLGLDFEPDREDEYVEIVPVDPVSAADL